MTTLSKKVRACLIALLCSLAVVFFGTALAIINKQQVTATTAVVWSDIVMPENLMEGDTFEVPNRKVNVNGREATANATVIAPNGVVVDNASFVLDIPGEYTIKYSVTENKRVYVKTEMFVAQYKTYRMHNVNSSAEYGAHKLAPGINGLVVRLAEEDTLSFNQIIDMNDKTMKDTLVEFFVTTDNLGVLDFNRLCLQFTDVANNDRFFKACRFMHRA